MKENKVVYKSGVFTDFTGEPRPYCFAAVSVNDESCVLDNTFKTGLIAQKGLYIGLSVVHPDDVGRKKKVKVNGVETEVPVYNEEIGKQIAYGKALNGKSSIGVIYATESGFINTKVVEALLEQEEAYFLANPGHYVAGYNKAHKRWQAEQLGIADLEKRLDVKINEISEISNKIYGIYNKIK